MGEELPRLAGLEGFEVWDRNVQAPVHKAVKTAFVAVRVGGTVGVNRTCYVMWGEPEALSQGEIVRLLTEALNEAEHLREAAEETLERYDGIVSELAALRLELHALKHDLEGIPDRISRARLDSLVYGDAEDPALLERRYVVVRERLPVVEARIGRLENELSNLCAGGSRPAKVDPDGGPRRLVKNTAREPILSTLNDVAEDLERLRNQLPDVVKEATADLLKQRGQLRDDQNTLWGLAKAQR